MRALCEDRKSGVLALSRRTDSVDVFYREGMIQAVSSNLESLHLGDYLLKQGYLTNRNFHSALTTVRKKGVSLGQLSVQRNLLAPSELARMLKCQAIDVLQHVLKTDFLVQSFSGAGPSFYAACNLNFSF